MRRALVLTALLISATIVGLPGTARASFISSLSVSPDSVRDGASSQGTVMTDFADTVPTTVLLFSGAPSVAAVPASVVVPAGSSSATFTITTNAAAPETFVTITAAIANVPRTATLVVNQATPAGPSPTAGVGHADECRGRRLGDRHGSVHRGDRRRERAAVDKQPRRRSGAG